MNAAAPAPAAAFDAAADALHVAVAPPDFDDWPALLALLRASFAYMAPRIDPPSSLQDMDIAQLQAKAAQASLIVAQLGRQLVGCAFAAPRGDGLYVGKLAVDAAMRGRGIARRLIGAAETLASAQGRRWLELQVRIELVENQATFAALGFAEVDRTCHPGYTRPTSITLRKPVAA